MRRIYWDTMLFVYLFERNVKFGERVAEIRRTMQQRGDALFASHLVFAEVLSGPTATGDSDAQQAVSSFFLSNHVSLLSFTAEAAPIFARLRAVGVKPPDAIHIATAAAAGIDVLLTNDKKLTKLRLPGLPLIASLETDIF
jgi:predicted nucleic acid-binding protein